VPHPDIPRIGIPCRYDDATRTVHRMSVISQNASYVHSVVQAGGVPVLIPPTLSGEMLRRVYETLQGLLLPGGVDVDPALYGQTAHGSLSRLDRNRDQTEISLARWAFEDRMPILGICRGIQVLNVALGGTLYQDIPSQVGSTIAHRRVDIERDWPAHLVKLAEGSRLFQVLGQAELEVNSLHHQAIETLAAPLRAVAWAPDGLIEGVERQDGTFCIAVQWHPEEFPALSPHQLLFRALVEAAHNHR